MSNAEVKVIFFNRDWTLMQPKSGHFSPQDSHDWQLMPNVYNTLQDLFLKDYHLAVITNQPGIATGHTTIELQQAINKELISHYGDQYSDQCTFFIADDPESFLYKPNTGAVNKLLEKFSIDYVNSKVVGNTIEDIQFASNANLNFIPADKFFNWQPQITVFCSFPGSGISTHISRYHPNDIRVSLDDIIRSMNREYHIEWKEIYYNIEEKMIVEGLKNGASIAIDRTNMSKKRRKRFIDILQNMKKSEDSSAQNSKQIHIICKYLDLPIDLCKERYKTHHVKTERELWEMEEFFDRMESEFEPPELKEGFDLLITLDKTDLTT